MQSEGDTAIVTVLVAVAVAGVEHVFDLFGVERNKAEAVGDEFISENGGVGLNFDKINGHGGNFGQHGAAQRVSKSKVDVAESKVDMTACSLLENMILASSRTEDIGGCRKAHFADSHSRSNLLQAIHDLVLHLGMKLGLMRRLFAVCVAHEVRDGGDGSLTTLVFRAEFKRVGYHSSLTLYC